MIGWFIKLSVQTFQPLIVIYKRVNPVYYYVGCTQIYRSLSYPFRSLVVNTTMEKYFRVMLIAATPPEASRGTCGSRLPIFILISLGRLVVPFPKLAINSLSLSSYTVKENHIGSAVRYILLRLKIPIPASTSIAPRGL